jgi:SAM-dependent methyltransferase
MNESPQAVDRLETAEAWTCFWKEQGAGQGCLDRAAPPVKAALTHHWARMSRELGAGSVVELGCGNATVSRAMLSENPKLRMTGVDIADIPETDEPGLKLLGRIAMEELPFADASFDAAVSQFAFEYSDVRSTAGEVARVLFPAAPIGFLVHHSASMIAQQERVHHEALSGLVSDATRSAFLGDQPDVREQRLSLLASNWPDHSTVQMAVGAMRKLVRASIIERERLWTAIVEALAPDMVLSRALLASCVDADRLHDWLEPLRFHFEVDGDALHVDSQPIAWRINGRRRG